MDIFIFGHITCYNPHQNPAQRGFCRERSETEPCGKYFLRRRCWGPGVVDGDGDGDVSISFVYMY